MAGQPLAQEFRGWSGARTWRSLGTRTDALSRARQIAGPLGMGLRDPPYDGEWHFEARTDHAPEEEVSDLATEMRTVNSHDRRYWFILQPLDFDRAAWRSSPCAWKEP
ncbi:DUF6228 family protein [Streptomyces sp. NPDC001315]|uniref:DUF6228 family protein n=1 Tax=Streptomyces sp. NPDC001315 TaxID=3364562 RepID=UPI003676BD24